MGEQPLPPNGSCLLSAINLSKYVLNPWTDKVRFDFPTLEKDLYNIYKAMNDVLDEGLDKHPLKEQRDIAKKYRNIGIGTMGWADVFIKFMTPYGSKKSKDLANTISKFLFRVCFECNMYYGKQDGAFPGFLIENDYKNTPIVLKHYSQRTINNMTKKSYKLRNCSMLTVAPTGSISNLYGCSGGLEPLFATQYIRRTPGMDGKEYTVLSGIVKEYLELHPEESADNLPYYFVTAHDIDWKDRIDIQAIIQDSTDSAISSTLNLPESTTEDEVEQLYLYAWKRGLKGVTIYRDGSRDPILSTTTTSKEQKDDTFSNGVVKRPKNLPAQLFKVKSEGHSYAVIVGLYDKKPYEIFTIELPKESTIEETFGIITKVKKGHYKFSNDTITLDHIEQDGNELQRATTMYTSMLLRHNADIEFIVKTAKKVSPNISSFTSAICRILNKFNTKETTMKCPQCGEEITKTGGCISCNHCGYSACNLLLTKKQ